MRKHYWVALFVLLVFATCTLNAAPGTSPTTAEQWGIYEITLKGPTNGNPFADVRFSALFDKGEKSLEVPGFYDGDGLYRIRFMPETQGQWRYETKANRWELTGKTGE